MLVTGAGGALGAELAVLAARAGWEVFLLDRTPALLGPVADRVFSSSGREPFLHAQDLVSLTPDRCDEICAAIDQGFGRLDALVHCAAEFDGLRPLEQIDPASWLRQFQVNVHAAWLLSVRLLPLLKRSESGILVFMVDELQELTGAHWGAYGVSKWALDAISQQFAAELSRSPVRVHAVDPGPMRSPLRARVYHAENPAESSAPGDRAAQLLSLIEDGSKGFERRIALADWPAVCSREC